MPTWSNSQGASFRENPHHRRRQGHGVRLPDVPLVVLLEARYYAQIGLAFRTMVLGLPSQNPAVRVHGVPAVIAAQSRAWTNHRAMAGSRTGLQSN